MFWFKKKEDKNEKLVLELLSSLQKSHNDYMELARMHRSLQDKYIEMSENTMIALKQLEKFLTFFREYMKLEPSNKFMLLAKEYGLDSLPNAHDDEMPKM
jgi:uncharacterized protein YdiU (UPF0061 family)